MLKNKEETIDELPAINDNVLDSRQPKLMRTCDCYDKSPWLAETKTDNIDTAPISRGEGRFCNVPGEYAMGLFRLAVKYFK